MNTNGKEFVGIKTVLRQRKLRMHKSEANSAVVKKVRLHNNNSEQLLPET